MKKEIQHQSTFANPRHCVTTQSLRQGKVRVIRPSGLISADYALSPKGPASERDMVQGEKECLDESCYITFDHSGMFM